MRILERLHAAHVVKMMVGDEYGAELKLAFRKGELHRCGITRIDDHCAAITVVQQPDVVVAECGMPDCMHEVCLAVWIRCQDVFDVAARKKARQGESARFCMQPGHCTGRTHWLP
jgi:hypothetical protein